MNINATSKEEILKASKQLVRTKGWDGVNIRSVASSCNVAVGSIYNYFDCKDSLVVSTVESIWGEIFHTVKDTANDSIVFQDTHSYVCWIYKKMEEGSKTYPNFFTLHSFALFGENKEEGKKLMKKTWQHIKTSLCAVIDNDNKIRKDAFTESFTIDDFANVLFSLILSAMIQKDYNSAIALEMINRILY